MSVPELPYSVSDHPLDCLRKTTKSIDELCSDINTLHDRDQLMYNYMVKQLQNLQLQIQPFKLQIQPRGPLSDPFNPDIYIFQGITLVFRKTIYEQYQTMYNYIFAKLQMQYMVNTLHERNLLRLNKVHERNQTMLQNFKLQMQPQAVPVSGVSISKVPSQKIFVSAETKPYKSDPLTKLPHFLQLLSLP